MPQTKLPVQSYPASRELYRPTAETVLQVEEGTIVFNVTTGRISCATHERTMIFNAHEGFFSCPKCSTAAAVKYLTEFE